MSTPVQVSVRCTTRKFCQTGRGTFTLLILWKRVQTLIMVDLQYILFRINCIKLHLVELSYNKLIVNYYYFTGSVQSFCQLLNVQLKKNYDSTPSVLEEAILTMLLYMLHYSNDFSLSWELLEDIEYVSCSLLICQYTG